MKLFVQVQKYTDTSADVCFAFPNSKPISAENWLCVSLHRPAPG